MFIPGDVLLFKRKKPIASAIRLIEGNPYNHSAVVIQAGDRRVAWVAEIDSDIPERVVPFEVALMDGTVEVFRHQDLTFNGDILWREALRLRGTKYNYPAIVQAAINHLIGRVLGFFHIQYRYRNFFPGTNTFVCSTLVSYLLHKGNKSFEYDPNAEPDDFCKKPTWVKIFQE